jgi:GcrA cell cycle regulator
VEQGVMPATTIEWTDDRVKLLKKLWAEGSSAGTIADKLGFKNERNAIIGKVRRLGLSSRVTVQRKARPAPKRTTPKPRLVNHGNYFKQTNDALPTLPIMPNGSDIPPAQRCTLLQLTSGVCKWPFGEPSSSDFFFCGGDAVEGKPYCAGHCSVAHKASWA